MTVRQLDHWILALPVEKNMESSFDKLSAVEKKFPGSHISKIEIPQLRMGTLDSLMEATDELLSLYEKAEGMLNKLVEVSEKALSKKRRQLFTDLQVKGYAMIEYLMKFQWDFAKFPVHHTIKGLCDVLWGQLNQTQSDLTKLSFDYFESYNELRALQNQQECSLVHRDVSLFVKKEDFVLDSQYLMTALVVVPKARYSEWLNCYERLDREVVPRSSFLIFEDEESGLFTVTLFKRHFELVKDRARELKFVVKDFIYDANKIQQTRDNLSKVRWRNKKLYTPFVKWLKANFSETYSAMVHIQALRVAVESALRYGLPANFFSFILSTTIGDSSRVFEHLKNEYEHVDESLKSFTDRLRYDESGDVPFVYFKVPAEMYIFK